MMTQTTVTKLLLARSLYHLAKENAASASGVRLSIACNLLQDSVESFLLALSEHVNADVDQRTNFDKYFEYINQKITPQELPFKARLIALNKLRVNSNHYGLEPSKAELEPLLTTVWEFFDEVTRSRFGKAFATISLIDLLRDNEAKDLLRKAENAFHIDDYQSCLTLCRQVLFVTFETRYDARVFLDAPNLGNVGGLLSSGVPHYARNKEYLEKHISQPTDFIILDHDDLEMELMKNGVDSTAFWNLWRLTPEVYRVSRDGSWIVKEEFYKFDPEGLRERAEYVLVTSTGILLTIDQKRVQRLSPQYQLYHLVLRRECVPVYSKASKNSLIAQTTPTGCLKMTCDYRVTGLDDSATYCHVRHVEKDVENFEDLFVRGFVHEDDVEG
ncbi:MAG: hypothetical protein WB676_00315 [Bryobacteraceae bacterium]